MTASFTYRKWGFAWLPLLVSALFFGCEADKNAPVTIDFWAMGAEGEHIRSLLPEFENRHPGIRVRVQSIPWGAAYEKLLTAYAGQATPDVCQLGNTWVPQFAMLNAILPLDSLIAGSAVVHAANYFAGVWQTNQIRQRTYGIPWYVDTRLLFYRKDLLQRVGMTGAPRTWEEWIQTCRKLRALPDVRYPVFFSLIYNDWQVPVILILSNGGQILRENDCYGAFDHPRTREALAFYLQFFREDLAPRTMTEFTNIYQGFATGQFAMTVTGPWNVNEIRRRSPEIQGKWSTAPMPAKESASSTAGGASLVIFRNSPHPAAAWKLIEFLSERETQVKFFRLTSDLPAVQAAWEAPELQNDPEIRAFFQQLITVRPTPQIAEWEQIAVKIQEHLEKAVYEQVTLDEAIRQLNRDVDRILEKRRWLLENDLLIVKE